MKLELDFAQIAMGAGAFIGGLALAFERMSTWNRQRNGNPGPNPVVKTLEHMDEKAAVRHGQLMAKFDDMNSALSGLRGFLDGSRR